MLMWSETYTIESLIQLDNRHRNSMLNINTRAKCYEPPTPGSQPKPLAIVVTLSDVADDAQSHFTAAMRLDVQATQQPFRGYPREDGTRPGRGRGMGGDSATFDHPCHDFNLGTCTRAKCRFTHICLRCRMPDCTKGRSQCTAKDA